MNLADHALKVYVDRYDAYQSVRLDMTEKGAGIAREFRDRTGMSIRRYAKSLRVSFAYLSKVESGREQLSADLARRMLEVHENG